MQFSQVIQSLRQDLRLPTLFPSADGTCAVTIDTVTVTLSPSDSGDAFTLYARIGHLDPNTSRLTAEDLLAANHSVSAMRGQVLALDTRRDVCLTQHVRSQDLTPGQVCAIVAGFTSQVHHWQQQVAPSVPAAA